MSGPGAQPDNAQSAARRRAALVRFRQALIDALFAMPMGYPSAQKDRDQFAGPVEQTIGALDEELTALVRKAGEP